MQRRVLDARAPHADRDPPRVPQREHRPRRGAPRAGHALRQPAPRPDVDEREAREHEQRARVRRVPYDGVRPRGDQLVRGEEGEVEGEEGPERAVAREPEERAAGEESEADESGRRDA